MSLGSRPRATYRLQFHRDFTFDDAVPLMPYLARLGISHLYASPLLKARPGSTHCYDIVDHDQVNPELGGEAGLRRLVAALRAHDMGLIADIVPNHMGVGGADNHWWLDVLEWGRASPFAEFFDIEWEPPDAVMRGRMLLPFLGSAYGEALADGALVLTFDPQQGSLFVAYHEHRLPLSPRTTALVLHHEPALKEIAHDFALRGGGRNATRAAAAAAKQRLQRTGGTIEGAAAIARALARFGSDTPEGQRRLDALLERQHYRIAWWRAAADEINWRRFFDINLLAGLRVERAGVFDATHRLILRLYAEALIDGVRVDHIDGLAEPRAYCRKLRRAMAVAGSRRPEAAPAGPPPILVEKILAVGERLARDWLTDGTTGYDFMDQASGVLHDPSGEAPLTALWTRLTGGTGTFEIEEQAARRQILRDNLASELNAAAVLLHRIGQRDLLTRDYTLTAIRRALSEILVHFPVYRIYAGPAGRSAWDAQVMARAVAGAQRRFRAADRALLEVVQRWLADEAPRAQTAGPRRSERLRAMVRFQQLSAPVAAKSVEDTAFYRFGRLLSRNEVGSNPGQFAVAPGHFHAASAERQQHFPGALLATATHDHKRGEDTRARLAVLSEIPGEWETALTRWMRLNAPLRRELDSGVAPSAADELMLYQTLVGTWPLGLSAPDAHGIAALQQRVGACLEKSLREAKLHSEWAAPDAAYETACRQFLAATLDPSRAVLREIAAFAHRLDLPGAVNGLGQTLLRLTAPGVPDHYQGSEFWDQSLVDPDNRRPVDFAARTAMLAPSRPASALLAAWRDGGVKQALIARALAARARAPQLFARGDYVKLEARGEHASHVLAFARRHGKQALVAAITRLPTSLLDQAALPLVPAARWGDTELVLPPGEWRDWLGDRAIASTWVGELFGTLPVALVGSG